MLTYALRSYADAVEAAATRATAVELVDAKIAAAQKILEKPLETTTVHFIS